MFWELLNRPRRRDTWSPDMSKFDFPSHTWRGANNELCVRTNKPDQLR